MVVVLFLGGREIEIGQSDLAGMAWCQIVKCLIDNGVVSDLELMAVFEDQNGGTAAAVRESGSLPAVVLLDWLRAFGLRWGTGEHRSRGPEPRRSKMVGPPW